MTNPKLSKNIDNSLTASKEIWLSRKHDGILHCAFCNDKDWLWENINEKFIACSHCKDMFERLVQRSFIPLSKHNEEIEKLKDMIGEERARHNLELHNYMLDNLQLNERISSIQEKAEKGIKKHWDRLKNIPNIDFCSCGKCDINRTIIKTCKEAKGEVMK